MFNNNKKMLKLSTYGLVENGETPLRRIRFLGCILVPQT